MPNFLRAAILPVMKTAGLLAATTLVTGCPSTDGSSQTANQPARTFQRGGETQTAVDTTVGAGHSASNGGLNFGGGMGGTANARIH